VIAALSAVVVLAAGVVPSPVPSFESVRATWRSQAAQASRRSLSPRLAALSK